jgi:hypothetical protein
MPDWLVTIGIFAILAGVALRIIAMMRASDAGGSAAAALHGQQLVRAHSRTFPQSWLPMLSRLFVLVGLAFVVVGAWIRVRG